MGFDFSVHVQSIQVMIIIQVIIIIQLLAWEGRIVNYYCDGDRLRLNLSDTYEVQSSINHL